MPVIPPSTTAPYDTIQTILQFARVIANDAQVTMDGDLLADSQPYTFTMLNLAWRKLQDRLGNNSIESFPEETILSAIPILAAAAQVDPGTQVYISFANYYNGATNNPAIKLPQDMEIPIKLWERPSGQNAQFVEMLPVVYLPSRAKTNMMREWEWREDALYMVGCTQITDIRLRYKRFIADPASIDTTPVPLLRCAVALAYLVVEVFATSRGSTMTQSFSSEKELAIRQIINNTTRKKQSQNFRRQPYSRRGQNRINW